MLRNILCTSMKKKIENLMYEFDNLLRGYVILRGNVHEKEVSALEHESCSISDFHSLMINFQTLLENTCEKDFLNYVRNEDDIRSKYIEMSNEHASLKTAYQTAMQNTLAMDTKLKKATNERDILISMFDELKQMLLNGSFKRLPLNTRGKVTSMIESVQKSTNSYVSPHYHNDSTADDEQTNFPTQTSHSLLPYIDDTLSFDTDETEVFIPDSPRIESPELLVPDSVDLCDENSESDQVNVTGDVQVITVTWDEMTDRSSDGVLPSNDYIDQSPDVNIDQMDSIPNLDVECIEKRHTMTVIPVLPTKKPPKVVKCDICDRNFSRVDSLARHKRIHNGKRPYLCDHCPATFTQSSHLKRHKLTHLEVRPYSCSICNRTFNRPSNRDRHVKNHSTKDTFFCANCQKCYQSKTNLRMHITSKACF